MARKLERRTDMSQDRKEGTSALEEVRPRKTSRRGNTPVEREESRFRDFSEAAADWFWELSPELEIIGVYGGFRSCTGLAPQEITGKTIYDLVSEGRLLVGWEDGPEGTRQGDSLHRGGFFRNANYRWRHRNGEYRLLKVSAKPVLDNNGSVYCYRGAVLDVTGNGTSESPSDLDVLPRALLDHVTPGILIHRCFRPLYVNRAFAGLFGYDDPSEIMALDSLTGLYAEEDRERLEQYYARRIRGDEEAPGVYEYRGVRRDGSEIWLENRASLFEWNGEPAVLLSTIDVTERKQALTQLQKLSAAVEQSPVGIVITDLDSTIEYINRKFSEITGWSSQEAIGQNPRINQSGKTPEETYRSLWAALTNGRQWQGVLQNRRKSGEIYWSRHRTSPIRDASGRITNYLAIIEDVSERRRLDEELRRTKEQAEQASQAKTNFLANMSHELRTPLNAIMGFSELIRNQMLGEIGDKRYLEYATDIYESGRHLLSIINDILDLAKIESGNVEIKESEVSVGELVESCVRLVGEKAARSRLVIETNIPKDLPRVRADERKLAQAVINLLANAVKFTPAEGRIGIDACLNDSGDMELTISDTGIGMRAEDIPHVLTPFSQIDSSLARQFEGTGLGLPLAQSYCLVHDGALELASEVGVGTKATIRLPRERVIR